MATNTVVLSDTQGNYYLLSEELIQNAKVTDAKQKQELEQSIQGGDTAGFNTFAAAQFQPLSFGATQFRALGACACNFNFDRGGLVQR
jgi:hypothetical protein